MVRVKRRYITVKVVKKKSQAHISENDLMNEIKNQVAQTYGDFGFGCLKRGFATKRYDPNDGYAIIQIRKGVHEMVMSVLPLITTIGEQACSLNMIHLSGTIRCSRKQLQQHYIVNLRAAIGQQLAASRNQNA